jgi:hypothetical protein
LLMGTHFASMSVGPNTSPPTSARNGIVDFGSFETYVGAK